MTANKSLGKRPPVEYGMTLSVNCAEHYRTALIEAAKILDAWCTCEEDAGKCYCSCEKLARMLRCSAGEAEMEDEVGEADG